MEFTPLLTSLSKAFHPQPLSVKTSLPFVILILSPHPDDESITGSLALRLQEENNAKVINIAVTLGSNKERRSERREELEKACEVLDIECLYLDESWTKKARELKGIIQKYQPDLIIAPHLKDFHPTHIKTGELLKNVLSSMKKYRCLVAWSEFWGNIAKPNLLIEVPSEILELQMSALIQHQGEIERNPYHLRLPAWMMDNVRRGSEIISGKGTNAPDFAFGVMYQMQLFKNGKFSTIKNLNSFLSSEENLGQIFKLILDPASGSKTIVK